MAITPDTTQITTYVCGFCGSRHISEESAIKNGCTGDDPIPAFTVGDIVHVQVKVGTDIQDVNDTWVNARVTEVTKAGPADKPQFQNVKPGGWEHYEKIYGIICRVRPHCWRYRVEPLEEPPTGQHYYTRVMYETELTLVERATPEPSNG